MKRLWWLLLFLAVPAFGNESAHGFCEVGNRQVVTSGLNSTTRVQQSFSSCTVTVFNSGTVVAATIYSDNANPPTAIPGGSFTANTNGSWQFYALNGSYDIVLSGGGFPTPLTLTATIIGGPTSNCANAPGATLGAKISASIAIGNSLGVVVDCSGVAGSNSITQDIGAGVTKPVTLILGNPSDTITVSVAQNLGANWTIINRATITASGSGAYLFNLNGSNSTFDCQGVGVLNGASTTWGMMAMAGLSGPISNQKLSNCQVKNWNPSNTGNTGYAVFAANASDDLVVNNNVVTNSGGLVFSSQGSLNSRIEHNSCNAPGYSCVNTSGDVNAFVSDNRSLYGLFFSYKAGFQVSSALTSDVAPTATSFSVPGTLAMRQQWRPGLVFTVFTSNTASFLGTVKTVTDNTTYLTIVTDSAMASAPPQPSGFPVETFDTAATYSDNYSENTAYNDFDFNVVYGAVFRHNTCRGGSGPAMNHLACIWVGADAQGAVNGFRSPQVTIEDSDVAESYGSCIQTFSTDFVKVKNNHCFHGNTSNTAGAGGIEVCRLGTQRCASPEVSGNIVVDSNGYGMWNGFTSNAMLVGNSITQGAAYGYGIVFDANSTTNVLGLNVVIAAGTALTVQDASGTNANANLHFQTGWIQTASGNTYSQQDVNTTQAALFVDPTFNSLTQSQGVCGGCANFNLFTVNSVPYITTGGVLAQDHANFFWDSTNHRLGVGLVNPSYPVDVKGPNGTGVRFTDATNSVQSFLGAFNSRAIIGTLSNHPTGLWSNNAEQVTIQSTASPLKYQRLPPIYANNAAAAAGGLVAGETYRTGADPDPLMIVH